MKISKYIIPILVVAALFSGYFLRTAFTQPTTSVSFIDSKVEAKIVCIVDGVKCKGTANFFTKMMSALPGIVSIETFATEHKVIISYDPQSLDRDDIKSVIEQLIPLRDGTSRQVFTCLSMKEI